MDFSKQLQKAAEAHQRRNYDFAVDLYRQLLEIQPDLGEARAGLRQALRKRAERGGGGKLLRMVGGALPMGRARTFLKMGRHDAAARALEDYLQHEPLDEEANLLLGRALEAAGHLRSALAVLEFLAEIAPRNVEALKSAGALLARTGAHARALECYERALAADPRDQQALKARKDLAAEGALRGSGIEVASHSRELIKDRERAEVLERERRAHKSEDELRAELERLEARYADAPSDPDLLVAMAELHERLGDFDAALPLLERALSYRKDSFELVARLGDLRSKTLKKAIARAGKGDQPQQAESLESELHAHELADYRQRVQLRPADPALRLQLGRRLMRVDRLDEALAELQRCVDDQRQRPEALFLLGQCFRRKGFLDLARQQFERAFEGLPAGAERAKEILYNLGAIAEAEHEPAKARGHYARIFEIDVGYKDVAAKMESLKHS